MSSYRQRHIAAGLCVYCDDRSEPGRTRCTRHREDAQRRNAERYAARQAAGLCVRCSRPRDKKAYCRNYIGIELNPEYIKIAEKRLSEVQVKLF